VGKNLLVSLNLCSAVIGEAEPIYFEDQELEELRTVISKNKVRFGFLYDILFSPASEIPAGSLPRVIRDLAALLHPCCGLQKSKGIVITLITKAADAIEEKGALCLWDSETVDEIDYEKAVKRVEDFYPEHKENVEPK